MQSFDEVKEAIELKIKSVKTFKIDKTGQTIKERFDEKYQNDFTNIDEMGCSDEEQIIDNLEEFLIGKFHSHPKCVNEQIGGGKMIKSDKYIIYLVWR